MSEIKGLLESEFDKYLSGEITENQFRARIAEYDITHRFPELDLKVDKKPDEKSMKQTIMSFLSPEGVFEHTEGEAVVSQLVKDIMIKAVQKNVQIIDFYRRAKSSEFTIKFRWGDEEKAFMILPFALFKLLVEKLKEIAKIGQDEQEGGIKMKVEDCLYYFWIRIFKKSNYEQILIAINKE